MAAKDDTVWVVTSFYSGKPEFEMVCQDQSTAWAECMAAMSAYWSTYFRGEFDPHENMSSSHSQGTTFIWVTGCPDSQYSYESVTVR